MLADGLQMNFMTYFTATVDAFRGRRCVRRGARSRGGAQDGERVRARVLHGRGCQEGWSHLASAPGDA